MAHRATALNAPPSGDADERRLIEAAQRDSRRFADLYESNFERIYAFIVRRVRDRDEAEDLTADVFHQALKHLGRFEWRGVPFAAWLYRIAANEISDRANRDARHRAVSQSDDAAEPCLEEIEHRALLFRMVDKLPTEQRRVIILRFTEERSIRDIAHQLKRTEGAVKQLQFRGLQNLRVLMGEKNG
ncbi:MAG TPA: sigma-70 family RNA polymerase sigma factor [Candidatus Binataceae bacterium]|nr:sigma-70 family RNA polymerase sigma factor [Candidatus Binataceae bacterium]